jgi:4-hydroxy-tetrahydrodipicolinate reductase
MHKLAIIGAEGRMGTALCGYLRGCEDMELIGSKSRDDKLEPLLSAGLDCIVDLSNGEGVDANGPSVVAAGIPYIVGATGYELATVERMRSMSSETGSPVLIAPNFSIGACLMILAARQAARFMDAPVISERHHLGKADAPSGTARYTAAGIADVRSGLGRHTATSTSEDFSEQLPGTLGGSLDGVAIHSIRGAGFLAEQQVLFSLPGESLSIEHKSIDRNCFMPGIAFCIRNISRVQGLVIGMENLMEL